MTGRWNTDLIFVPGTPAPQGSTRAYPTRNGKIRVTADNPRTYPWRDTITIHTRAAVGPRIPRPTGEIGLGLLFLMPRRASEPKRVTPSHTRKPDLDKLARAALDALSGVLYTDDAQVTHFTRLAKRTAEPGEQPGLLLSWQYQTEETP